MVGAEQDKDNIKRTWNANTVHLFREAINSNKFNSREVINNLAAVGKENLPMVQEAPAPQVPTTKNKPR